jgi:hypothetical protein
VKFLELITEKWNEIYAKVKPGLSATGDVLKKIADIFVLIGSYIVKLRKIFLAIPVVVVAVKLARDNIQRLPEVVGLNLQVDGTFAIQISRAQACWGPLLLTLVSLLLMCCSKRVLTPWVVSLLTLIIPVFIWVINVFPS